MSRPHPPLPKLHSRREALRYFGGITAGLIATGCTPMRMVFGIYPEDFDREPERVDRAIRAFMTSVVPGVPEETPGLSRVFNDRYYPMHRFRNFFASDLCSRSTKVVGRGPFEALSPRDRARVIQHGLDAGGTTSRLYRGAVFITQVALLGGIYDDQEGCSLIDFRRQYRVRRLAEITYPERERFLASTITPNGNPS